MINSFEFNNFDNKNTVFNSFKTNYTLALCYRYLEILIILKMYFSLKLDRGYFY